MNQTQMFRGSKVKKSTGGKNMLNRTAMVDTKNYQSYQVLPQVQTPHPNLNDYFTASPAQAQEHK